MKHFIYHSLITISLFTLLLSGCRTDDEEIIIHQEETVDEPDGANLKAKGFFLLNEGNMGSNKCTLDYYDAVSGTYVRNIYGEANPTVVQELGDVGNDIQIYREKVWAVINCSHFVEIMDATTARHITQVSIPNCRYVAFKDDYAYVTSYAGPVLIDPNARLGYVAKVNVNTFEVEDTCTVGYQPDELVVCGDKLYVANSGGYRVPDYDSTVSVIDLKTFKVCNTIPVTINLHRLELDNQGFIWVSSRGDYYDVPSRTFVIDPNTDTVVDQLDIANTEMTLAGDSLLIYGTEWSYIENDWTITWHIVDTRTRSVISDKIITDGTETKIRMPYGIAVNPDNRDIYITDAKDYVSPGRLFCYDKNGVYRWDVRTGDIPSHFAFTDTRLTY